MNGKRSEEGKVVNCWELRRRCGVGSSEAGLAWSGGGGHCELRAGKVPLHASWWRRYQVQGHPRQRQLLNSIRERSLAAERALGMQIFSAEGPGGAGCALGVIRRSGLMQKWTKIGGFRVESRCKCQFVNRYKVVITTG